MVRRIALITPFFFPVVGGLEKHVFHLATELVKKGYRVDVLTSDIDREGNHLPHYEKIDSINVYRFKTIYKLGDFASLWPGFLKRLRYYDIIHVHNYRHPHTILAAIYCKVLGKHCIITTHSPFHPKRETFLSRFLIKLYDKVLSNFIDRLFSYIITVNISEYKYFSKRGFRNVEIITSAGISNDFIAHKPSKKARKYITVIGRLHPSKGIHEAIKIFQSLFKVYDDTRKLFLKIVGPVADQDYYKNLLNLVKNLGLEDFVEFTGPVDEDGVKNILDESFVLLVSSPYEAAGLVIVEALARGVPVVARLSPGPLTLKLHCPECIHTYLSVAEAVEELLYILSYEKCGTDYKMFEECVKCAKRFTWTEMTNKILKVYNKLFLQILN